VSGEASAKAEDSAFDYQQVAFDLKERETPMADILSNIGSALRPVAKEMIKGGMYLFDSLSEVALEAGEHFKDLVAEAKADLAQQNGKPPAEVEKDDRKDRREPKRRVHVRRSR